MTDAEILLWSGIRRRSIAGYQFYRQKIIDRPPGEKACLYIDILLTSTVIEQSSLLKLMADKTMTQKASRKMHCGMIMTIIWHSWV